MKRIRFGAAVSIRGQSSKHALFIIQRYSRTRRTSSVVVVIGLNSEQMISD